jgi:hypothetical protein
LVAIYALRWTEVLEDYPLDYEQAVTLLRPTEHPVQMRLVEAVLAVLALDETLQADAIISPDEGGPVMTLGEIYALHAREDFPRP